MQLCSSGIHLTSDLQIACITKELVVIVEVCRVQFAVTNKTWSLQKLLNLWFTVQKNSQAW